MDFKTCFLPIIFLVFFSLPANAATTTGPYEVKSLIVGALGVHVQVSPPPTQCNASWAGTQFVLLRESLDYKAIYAGLLAAQITGHSVMVWVNTQGDGSCSFQNQPSIDALQIISAS